MSSKKQRKDKQRARLNKDKIRAMKTILEKEGATPFQLEPWMGHSSLTFYKLNDIYDILELEGDVENVQLQGRNIGCPSEITILAFNNDHVKYDIDGKITVGKTDDYLVEVK